jgi:hypothetical protein
MFNDARRKVLNFSLADFGERFNLCEPTDYVFTPGVNSQLGFGARVALLEISFLD